MEEISKKELLEVTGISYGQLYRWKRKGLIPEAWFLKKAAFTGQETYFPRAEILARVERIQGLKDDINLDQLALLLSPQPSQVNFSMAALLDRNLASQPALELLAQTLQQGEPFSFDPILLARIITAPLAAGALSREEAAVLLRTLWQARETAPLTQGELLFLRKQGIGLGLLVQGSVALEPDARVALRLDLASEVTKLKLAINGGDQ